MQVFARVLLAISFVALPVLASAATEAELQQKIQDLKTRTEQLQQKIAAGSADSGANSPACPAPGKILKRGSSGDDVRRLQQFLARDPGIYPEGTVSGSYGPLTEAAVKRWQVKFNIVTSGTPSSTGFGVAGSRTLSAMIAQCSGSTRTSPPTSSSPVLGGLMTVSPMSGEVPLVVVVQVSINTANDCNGGVYTIDYGDGTIPYHMSVPVNKCQQVTHTLSHTYQNAGTFLLSLSAGTHRTAATISVSPRAVLLRTQTTAELQQQYLRSPSQDPSPDYLAVDYTSGRAPLRVVFNGVMNGPQSCKGGVYTLTFGDGEAEALAYDPATCLSYAFQAPHVYGTAGTYTAELHIGNAAGYMAGNRVITVY